MFNAFKIIIAKIPNKSNRLISGTMATPMNNKTPELKILEILCDFRYIFMNSLNAIMKKVLAIRYSEKKLYSGKKLVSKM